MFFAAFDTRSGALTSFAPEPDNPPYVLLPVGNTLYAGGNWYHVGGVAVPHAAAFDLRTERLLPWNPKANDAVWALAVDDASVYVGGDFTSLHDWELRDGKATIDLRTGRLADLPEPPPPPIPGPFNFQLDGPLSDWVVANGRRYLAGGFVRVNGQFHPFLAAVDAVTGQLLPWDPLANPENRVFGGFDVLAARGNTIYVGGQFSGPPWFPRRNLAALDGMTGALLPWDPHATGDDPYNTRSLVRVLEVRDDEVWVGGNFNRIGGEPRLNLAVLDATSAVPSAFHPDPDGVINVIQLSGDDVYVGGAFRTLAGFPHAGIAAFHLRPDASAHLASSVQSTSVTSVVSLSARPNPMHTNGVIDFDLAAAARVRLVLYDIRGRRLASLVDDEVLPAGSHSAPLNVAGWAPGVYSIRLETLGQVRTGKIVVMN